MVSVFSTAPIAKAGKDRKMKIILLQDEKKLGKKGDVIEASDGFARNYILPKKIGIEATAKNMNELKLQKANSDKLAREQMEAAKALATELEDTTDAAGGILISQYG